MRSVLLAAVAALVSLSAASAATHHHHRTVARPHATAGQCRDAAGTVVKCGPAAVTDLEGVPLARGAGCREGAYSVRKPQTPCLRPTPVAQGQR